MSDEKKLTLGARAPLGIKKTVEAGKVRQSFSHGRSKSVVVEVKKRKIIGKADTVEEAQVAPPAPIIAVRVAPPPPPRKPQRPSEDGMGSNDRLTRQEALQAALRRGEEERRVAAEEARKRQDAEREAVKDAARDARANKAEDASQPIVAQEEASPTEPAQPKPRSNKPQAGAPAQPFVPDLPVPPKGAEELRSGRDGRKPLAPTARAADDDEDSRKGNPSKAKLAPAKPARPRTDERRQSGKLTVTKALSDDDAVKVRSLAALRRAREKERRAHMLQGPSAKQSRDVVVPEAITVAELANRMAERTNDLIRALGKMGVDADADQVIDQDTAELLVTDFGHVIKRVADSDVEIGLGGIEDDPADLSLRPPIVTIMGHVDHGKTSLLDALRKSNVVSGEAGGITQHIGAYQVTQQDGSKITFLDTPGHEAFTQMRARGANVTDIVIIVVAADDGLMPQTIEAINHTKAAGVPMIVAINKMDRPGADPAKIRQALLQHNVIVEAMSGDVQDVEISALKKTGLDDLMGKIALQAEILELKTNPNRPAEGTVIEAKLDKGRGPVATVLVRRGTLKVGDIFVIGAEWGKVRALVNDQGKQVKIAEPSQPVEVLGISGVPGAGDEFFVVENEARAREVASYRSNLATRLRTTSEPVLAADAFANLNAAKKSEFNLVLKADVQGSVEAITQAVTKLSNADITVRVLHAGVGAITESDVTLAKASNAPIIAFNVRPNPNAREAADRDKVEIKNYTIIYNLIDDMKAGMIGQLGPQMIETVIGQVTVKDVFQAGKSGKAAGCYVSTGVVKRNSNVRLLRDNNVVYSGKLTSLRRFKDDVPEVKTGLECGMSLENFIDIKAGDVIEAYEISSQERTL